MSAEIEIISAGEHHVEEIAPLFDAYRVWYGKASDLNGARSYLSHRLRQGESVVFLAKSDGVPVGFTQLYPLFSSVSLGAAWLLNDLFVVESARQRGVGTELLEAAAEFGRQTGALRLHLQAAVDNRAAQAVYRRHGWVQDNEFLYFTLDLA